jgi:hypothetical protein
MLSMNPTVLTFPAVKKLKKRILKMKSTKKFYYIFLIFLRKFLNLKIEKKKK